MNNSDEACDYGDGERINLVPQGCLISLRFGGISLFIVLPLTNYGYTKLHYLLSYESSQ